MVSVIAISRQFGSGGSQIGRAVAQRLGYRFADRDILAKAAGALELSPEDVAPMEEHVDGFWARFAQYFALGSPDTPYMPPAVPVVTNAQVSAAEQRVVREVAAAGHAVIVGRGAAHLLTGQRGVLRVFLHAPVATRVARAMTEYQMDDTTAQRTLRELDDTRAAYAHTLSDRPWHDATSYDLCVDTASAGVVGAVELIVAAAAATGREAR